MNNSTRIDSIRYFMTMDWTEEQEQKLLKAFSLIDEVMWLCERNEKMKEIEELKRTIIPMELMSTAIMVRKMVEDINNNENSGNNGKKEVLH